MKNAGALVSLEMEMVDRTATELLSVYGVEVASTSEAEVVLVPKAVAVVDVAKVVCPGVCLAMAVEG